MLQDLAVIYLSMLLATVTVMVAVHVFSPSNDFDYFDQQSFPCSEDEVLGYVPGNFDHIECIHIDEFDD